eukprot:210661_1
MYNWYINNIIKWYKLMRWSINNIWSNMMIINGTFLGATWSANIKSLIGSDGYLNELPPESLSTSSCPWSAVRIHLNHQHVTFKSISNIIIRIIIWYNSINWSISSNTWCQWYISRIIIGWISKCIINKMIKWISKCIIKCIYYFTATLTSTVSNLWFTTTLISTVSNLRICLSSTGPASKSSQHQLSSASANIAACETNLAGGFNYNFISRIFSIWIIIMCIISTSSSSTTTHIYLYIDQYNPYHHIHLDHDHYLNITKIIIIHSQTPSTSTPSTPLLHKHMITQLGSCNKGYTSTQHIYKQNHHQQYQITYGLTPTHLWIQKPICQWNQQSHLWIHTIHLPGINTIPFIFIVMNISPIMDSTNPSANGINHLWIHTI